MYLKNGLGQVAVVLLVDGRLVGALLKLGRQVVHVLDDDQHLGAVLKEGIGDDYGQVVLRGSWGHLSKTFQRGRGKRVKGM